MKKVILFLAFYNFFVNLYSMNIGGQLSLPMSFNRHNEFNLGFKLAPSYGWFITDNFELRGNFQVSYNRVFSSEQRIVSSPVFWGFSIIPTHYFNTKSHVRPYIGTGLGWQVMGVKWFSSHLIIEVPIGLLVDLGKNFALDISIPFQWHISMRSSIEKIDLPSISVGLRYAF